MQAECLPTQVAMGLVGGVFVHKEPGILGWEQLGLQKQIHLGSVELQQVPLCLSPLASHL